MKAIISRLVDPDAKNNDHEEFSKLKVSPETALKYLQLVTPKCEDYLLICSWNNRKALCRELFRLVLTDSGYCCSFNAHDIDTNTKDSYVSTFYNNETNFKRLFQLYTILIF